MLSKISVFSILSKPAGLPRPNRDSGRRARLLRIPVISITEYCFRFGR